jgi:hypothetical protein
MAHGIFLSSFNLVGEKIPTCKPVRRYHELLNKTRMTNEGIYLPQSGLLEPWGEVGLQKSWRFFTTSYPQTL